MEAWERGTLYEPDLRDKQSLMVLDAILRHPETPED
jgi:hypothetical protein